MQSDHLNVRCTNVSFRLMYVFEKKITVFPKFDFISGSYNSCKRFMFFNIFFAIIFIRFISLFLNGNIFLFNSYINVNRNLVEYFLEGKTFIQTLSTFNVPLYGSIFIR
uniref:Uncharacterized protein n=1 Tax=Sipha flava TaxID=143950 RepID=A0A2S2R0K0_9HEMI